ncbi:MAG TPA: hypothetical protein VGF66_12265 [Gaiellaceae bacterium]
MSDSVLTAVTWGNATAQAALEQNLDVQIDAGVCRRLNVQSCEFNGGYVPTALDVINGWRTSLGPVVLIVDGYNDLPASFAADVELTLDTLRDDGVQHILWVNLHAVRPEYVQKNAVLAAAALHYPELRVLDWNAYSSAHPEWYQTDYIHLVPAGGVAIAAYIHQAILEALAPPQPQTAQPKLVVNGRRTIVGRVGKRIDRTLRATGGVGQLRWLASGRALRQAKLHLLARGVLRGRPSRPGTHWLNLEVVDSRGATARVTIRFTVRPRHR